MPGQKITDLDALAAFPADGDFVPLVDVSDTSEAATGTTKKLPASYLRNLATVAFGITGTHTLASADYDGRHPGSTVATVYAEGAVTLTLPSPGGAGSFAGGVVILDARGGAITISCASTSIDGFVLPQGGSCVLVVDTGIGYQWNVVGHGLLAPHANYASNGGNPTTTVAPQQTAYINGLADAANANYDFDPVQNGVFRFAVNVTVKRATGGEYRTDDWLVTCTRISGTMALLGTPVQVDMGGDPTGLTVTITATGGSLRVNVANATGQAVTGYVWLSNVKGGLV